MPERQEHLVVDGDVYKTWCHIGTARCLTSHTEIATFLIQLYQGSKDGGTGSWLDTPCIHCNKPLTLLCMHCHLPQQQQPQQQQQQQQFHSVDPVSGLAGTALPVAVDQTMVADLNISARRYNTGDKLQSSQVQQEGQDGSATVEYAPPISDPDWHSEVVPDLHDDEIFTRRSDPQIGSRAVSCKGREKGESKLCLSQGPSPQPEKQISDGDSNGHQGLGSLKDDSKTAVTSNETEGAVEGKEWFSQEGGTETQNSMVGEEEFERSVATVVNGSRRSYRCRECGKRSSAHAVMRYHLLQHRNYGPHSCKECGAIFFRHQELSKHIHSSHSFLAKKCFAATQSERRESERPKDLTEETDGLEGSEKPLNEEVDIGTGDMVEQNVKGAIIWVNGKQHLSMGEPAEDMKEEEQEKPHAKDKEDEDNDDVVVEEVKTEEDGMIMASGGESFSCRECGQAFTRHCSLARHVRSHTNDRRYSCKKCSSAFYRLSHLKMHVMRKHQSVRPFICSLCSAAFTDAYHLHRHEGTHTKHQPYKCSECLVAFSNTRQLKSHLQTHLLAGMEVHEHIQTVGTQDQERSESFSCVEKDCAKTSMTAECVELENVDGFVDESSSSVVDSSSSSVNVELQGTDRCRAETSLPAQEAVTPGIDKRPSTDTVPRGTGRPSHGKNALDTDAEWKAFVVIKSSANSKRKRKKPVKRVQKQYTCTHPGCVAALPSPSSLRQHMCSHTGEKPYLCKHCGQGFTKQRAVKQHELLHLDVKPFVCKECGHTFSQHSHLVKHSRQHTGERPYVCSVCGAAFLEPSHLKRHNRKHTGEKPYMCEWCGASFIQSGELKTHIMAMHTDHRPFKCSQCPKAYTTSSLLRVHMRTHTGERPYVCSHCGAAFKIISHLKDHTLKHTGEKPKQCAMCPSAYTRTSHLKRHMLRAHPGWDPLTATQSVWTAKENATLPPSIKQPSTLGPSVLKAEGAPEVSL